MARSRATCWDTGADVHEETSQQWVDLVGAHLSVPTARGNRMLHKRSENPDAIGGHLVQEARNIPGGGQLLSGGAQQEEAQRAHGLRKSRGVIAERGTQNRGAPRESSTSGRTGRGSGLGVIVGCTAEPCPSLRRRPRPPRGTSHDRRRAADGGTSASNSKLGHGRHIGRKRFGGKVFVARAVQAREEATRITRNQEIA